MRPLTWRRWPAFLLALALVGATPSWAGSAPSKRFFFSGDGELRLHHAHFGIEQAFHFRRADGTYDDDALAALRHFFRSRTDHEIGPLSLRLLELLDFVEDRFRPQRITLYSAYRSAALNAKLPGTARASLHTQGLAADIGIEGYDIRKVWEELRELGMGGVGLYPGDAVLHLDAGPPRFWQTSTSRVGEDLSAGNARIFARTEYDRYGDLDGALISLHSVTAFPIGFQRRLASGFDLLAVDSHLTFEGDCVWIHSAQMEHRLRLRRTGDLGIPPPRHIALETCPPRAGRTPELVETNRIELLP